MVAELTRKPMVPDTTVRQLLTLECPSDSMSAYVLSEGFFLWVDHGGKSRRMCARCKGY